MKMYQDEQSKVPYYAKLPLFSNSNTVCVSNMSVKLWEKGGVQFLLLLFKKYVLKQSMC